MMIRTHIKKCPLISLSILLSFAACKTAKDTVYETEISTLDTLTVMPEPLEATLVLDNELPIYHAAADRKVDLIHTALDLRFDFDEQKVIGRAELTIKPYFYPVVEVVLDAVGFQIQNIQMLPNNKDLPYEYDDAQMRIELPRAYNREEEIKFAISYHAYPERNPQGGSAAITNDKGLFFIDPKDLDPDKPTQIWTQGETENNSRWFPTIDKPNERTTQDIKLTVEDKYATLSNGKKVSSVKNADGTRTDRYVMDLPHAPYLFMVAVGEFAVVEDQYKDIPLGYYVEPTYKSSAAKIFNHTPEMLEFFSNKLNYPYPWPKYDQIVVRDFVSGAMENTTAVIFGEFVQHTERGLIDNDNDLIVAHEMFHHWFGDLVTCESWSNLTLNEGFANYSEYMWYEHKYGKDRAEAHRLNELNGYLGSAAQQGIHPLIHYSYEDKEDMFDAHSYNKGGLVLHMLRDYLGDEAFFAALNRYLTDNAFTAVEVDELRMAFEDVTGMDLQWFFDQWYLAAGHPKLEVTYGQDEATGLYTIVVSQLQEGEDVPHIFRLPVDVALYDQMGEKHLFPIEINQRYQAIILRPGFTVAFAQLDDQRVILAEIDEVKDQQEYIAQATHEDNYILRMQALKQINGMEETKKLKQDLLNETYHSYRLYAIDLLDPTSNTDLAVARKMALNDPHSSVRQAALEWLSDQGVEDIVTIAGTVLDKEQAYPVLGSALKIMYAEDASKAEDYMTDLTEMDENYLAGTLADIFASSGDKRYLPFFESRLSTVGFQEMFNFYAQYAKLVKRAEPLRQAKAGDLLARIGGEDGNSFKRFVATNTLYSIYQEMKQRADSQTGTIDPDVQDAAASLKSALEIIVNKETNPNLSSRYSNYNLD